MIEYSGGMQTPSIKPVAEISHSMYLDFCRFLEQHSGIVLGESKQYLVRSRLASLAQQESFGSIEDMLSQVMRNGRSALRSQVIDAMTTNETFWFRDTFPYQLLSDTLLPEFRQLTRPVKIWSAACSSGQEPFSMAMIIDEFKRANPGLLKQDPNILASDISESMLSQCREASYDGLAVSRGLCSERLQRHFKQGTDGRYLVNANLRKYVEFRRHNLTDSSLLLGKFDIVFCRNVLIYFSAETKRLILRQIAAALQPGGILVLGSSESLAGISDEFKMIRASSGFYYQKQS
ncbi:CheR family methyltransferase [Paraferrimonas sedimenticola]